MPIIIIFIIIIILAQFIGLMSRVLTNGPGDRGSIIGQIIPKTQKKVLDTILLNTQHYKVSIKGKVGQSREVAPFLTPWCNSFWKEILRVTFDQDRQLYFFFIILRLRVFHTSASRWLSLDFESQQVSSSLQDSS